MQFMKKKKAFEILRKYTLRGNGSDMVKHDFDDDSVGDVEGLQLTNGRFS